MHRIHYTYQEGEGGIADALRLAEPFVEGEKICVMLGDNIIESNVIEAKQTFERQQAGAHIMLKEVPDPERFGVPEISDGRILGIEEKPKSPQVQIRGNRPLLLRRYRLRKNRQDQAQLAK